MSQSDYLNGLTADENKLFADICGGGNPEAENGFRLAQKLGEPQLAEQLKIRQNLEHQIKRWQAIAYLGIVTASGLGIYLAYSTLASR